MKILYKILLTSIIVILFNETALPQWCDWFFQEPLPQGFPLSSIRFINQNTGFASGGPNVLKTTNGGLNWIVLTPDCNVSYPYFNKVFFTDVSTGYLLGNLIYKTTNSGLNWYVIPSITGNDLQFTNSSIGYVTGNSGTIYKTTNSGINWIRLSTVQA